MTLKVDFRRDERPAEVAEEILNWSVQIPPAHRMSVAELSEALKLMQVEGAPPDAQVQVHGNLVMAWLRRPVPRLLADVVPVSDDEVANNSKYWLMTSSGPVGAPPGPHPYPQRYVPPKTRAVIK